jgi:hypothetical protein
MNLGLITPDITRSLGYISQQAGHLLSDPLGLITPDITRSLGAQELSLGGVDWKTWATILGLATVGAGAAGYVATKSGRSAGAAALGGLVGSAAGVWLTKYLNQRSALARVSISTGEMT